VSAVASGYPMNLEGDKLNSTLLEKGILGDEASQFAQDGD
jgi:hypothetical protein